MPTPDFTDSLFRRDANPASPCSAGTGTTTSSVPPKTFQTPLLINYPLFCSCIVPGVHPLAMTSPATGTPGGDPPGTRVSLSDPPASHARLSKSLIPEFRDGSHSPEPQAPLHRTPSPNELK